jgi:thiamine biosynthesis lipoprotein
VRTTLGALIALAGCVSALVPQRAVVERRLGLMGTALQISVEATSREAALAASERAVQALEAAEARLSTWRDDTELALLNQAPVGELQTLSPALAGDLDAAQRCWRETDGAFDPAVGALVRTWDLRGRGRIPTEAERRAAVDAGRMDGLRLEGRTAVRERTGLVLEEGGFGKGAGLADALAVLAGDPHVARASLNLGGQIAVFDRGTGERWEVPVADPARRERAVVSLSIGRGSVSTSGNSERGIEVDGRRIGHILDPRTGEPAPDFGSLTVWTEDPLRADCLSTGLYVMGPERALAWAAAHPGVEVLVLRREGRALKAQASPGLRGRLKALTPELVIGL